MKMNVASQTSPRPLFGASLYCCRGLRRSESAILGPTTTTTLRLSRSPRSPTLRRSSIASCYFGDHHSNRDLAPAPPREPFCPSKLDLLEPSLLGIRPEPPDWPAREDLIRDSIARRANCVDLPLSLRMIKKKQKHQQRVQEKGVVEEEKGSSMGVEGGASISRAFSSTVFVIRELHNHALQLRCLALREDVEPITGQVQKEMHSSFIWLFREVFSRTPNLMADMMVLIVDFAAHSMEKNKDQLVDKGASQSGRKMVEEAEEKAIEDEGKRLDFASPLMGGDNKNAELFGGSFKMIRHPNVVVPGAGSSQDTASPEKGGMEMNEEEKLWSSMVEEPSRMQMEGVNVDEQVRVKTAWLGSIPLFVSPVRVEIEADDYDEYYRTDLIYQVGVYQEPNNPLLLSNYAKFLYLVKRDYERAEECFQRAIQLDSKDAEVLSQYATFLWVIRKDLWGAEERYQQAMAAEPDNPYHSSRYATFLWNTGGEDTCYPFDVSPTKN